MAYFNNNSFTRFMGLEGLGQIGTQADQVAASANYAQMYAKGQLILCKGTGRQPGDMGQANTYVFDPAQPDIIYAITPNLGNGPGGSSSPFPGCCYAVGPSKYQYRGNIPVPWMGEISQSAYYAANPQLTPSPLLSSPAPVASVPAPVIVAASVPATPVPVTASVTTSAVPSEGTTGLMPDGSAAVWSGGALVPASNNSIYIYGAVGLGVVALLFFLLRKRHSAKKRRK